MSPCNFSPAGTAYRAWNLSGPFKGVPSVHRLALKCLPITSNLDIQDDILQRKGWKLHLQRQTLHFPQGGPVLCCTGGPWRATRSSYRGPNKKCPFSKIFSGDSKDSKESLWYPQCDDRYVLGPPTPMTCRFWDPLGGPLGVTKTVDTPLTHTIWPLKERNKVLMLQTNNNIRGMFLFIGLTTDKRTFALDAACPV